MLATEAQVAILHRRMVHLVVIAAADKVLSAAGTHALLERLVNFLTVTVNKLTT
jgi:hypothetical protein